MVGETKYGSYCRRFQANRFNVDRCQNCFRAFETHSDDARKEYRIMRKVVCCGYLSVAPPNFDAASVDLQHSLPRRWQRRWFSLFDDGKLSYALDQHPETVPQRTVDMTVSDSVKLHKTLGQHMNCVEVSGQDSPLFIKADSADDILRWYSILSMYCNQQDVKKRRSCPSKTGENSVPALEEADSGKKASGTTLVEVTTRRRSKELTVSRSSPRRMSDPLSQAKVDVSRNDSFHGTPRSVKHRSKLSVKQTKEDVAAADRRSSSDVSKRKDELLTALADENEPTEDSPQKKAYEMPKVDVSTMHTLRKGWLMLRGRSNAEWHKHWVVLAGLSLKLFKDAWAEDSGIGLIEIDLTDCESVYPISVARNYGVEIRCKHSRYVLSAMTPGIRDSWISAIQQNLHSPSPTSPTMLCQKESEENGITWRMERKKRIAYVAPESHHRSSNDASSSEPEEHQMEDQNRDNLSVSERSLDLDSGTMEDDREDTDTDEADDRRSRISSGSTGASRRPSLSPTLRRSPVSRLKDRASRRQRSPGGANSGLMSSGGTGSHRRSANEFGTSERRDFQRNNRAGSSSEESSQRRASEYRRHHPCSWEQSVGHLEQENQQLRYQLLETQVETLREELERTRNRLLEAEAENRDSSVSAEEAKMDLERLRRCLVDAEREVLDRQDEMEALKEELDSSVAELTGTETKLTVKAKELESERSKIGEIESDFHKRIDYLERQLESMTERLGTNEAELSEKSELLESTQQTLREYESRNAKESCSMEQASNQHAAEITQLRNTLEARDNEILALTERLKEAEKEKSKLSSDDSMTRKTLDSYLSVIRERDEMIESLRSDRDSCKLRLAESETEKAKTIYGFLRKESGLIANYLDSPTDWLNLVRGLHCHLTEAAESIDDPENREALIDLLNSFKEKLSSCEKFGSTSRNSESLDGKSVRNAETEMEKLHGDINASNALTASVFDSDSFVGNASDSFLSIPEFEWNYTLSPMHEDLAKSLASYLADKAHSVREEGRESLEDCATYSAEVVSLEIALVGEVADILEHAGNDKLIQLSVLMHDIRNAGLTLKSMYEIVRMYEKSRDLELFDEAQFSAFPILVSQIRAEILARFEKVEQCVAEFIPGAVHRSAKELVTQFLQSSWPGGMLVNRNSMLKLELASLFARFQTLSSTSTKTETGLNEGVDHLQDVEEELTQAIDDLLESLCPPKDETVDLDAIEVEHLLFAGKSYWEFLSTEKLGSKGLLEPNHEQGIAITLTELTEEFCSLFYVSRDNLDVVCRLLVLKAFAQTLLNSVEIRVAESGMSHLSAAKEKKIEHIGTVSPELRESLKFYQPLARKLVSESLWGASVRLVAAIMASYYESFYGDKIEAAYSTQCDACDRLNLELAHAVREIDELKRRSISDEIGFGRVHATLKEEIDQLKRKLVIAETRFERERRKLQGEIIKSSKALNNTGTGTDFEVRELEQEILDAQSMHSDDLDSLRHEMNGEIDSIRDQLAKERMRRKKLQADMLDMKKRNDQSFLILEQSHRQMISNIKDENRAKIQEVREEYEEQLVEEKEATRHAIDALQKAHKAELQKQVEKIKLGSFGSSDFMLNGGERHGSTDSMDKRQSQMLEQMSKELSELSAAFSAKCLENSQLEEELSELRNCMEKEKWREKLKTILFDHERQGSGDSSILNGLTASSSVENLSSPTGQRERRMSQRNRRNDNRFHTVHNGEMESANPEKIPQHVLHEFHESLGVPVSERRRYFESLAGNFPRF